MRRAALVLALLLAPPFGAAFASPAHADATIVMIAVTPSGDGVLTVPVGGDAAFAVAVINVGDAPLQYLPQHTLSVTGPVTHMACQTDPRTGSCLDPQPAGVIAPGEVQTFSVFVHVSEPGAFRPASVRLGFALVALDFGQTSPPVIVGAAYASTSVALKTEPSR